MLHAIVKIGSMCVLVSHFLNVGVISVWCGYCFDRGRASVLTLTTWGIPNGFFSVRDGEHCD